MFLVYFYLVSTFVFWTYQFENLLFYLLSEEL